MILYIALCIDLYTALYTGLYIEASWPTAGDLDAFAVQLTPDLVGAIDLHVGVPDPLDFRAQDLIALGACRKQAGVPLSGSMAPTSGEYCGPSNPQNQPQKAHTRRTCGAPGVVAAQLARQQKTRSCSRASRDFARFEYCLLLIKQ